MSRGMQQKVAIARALLTSPALLLLDEPTTGLDPRSKLDVQTFIEELRETHDASIVLTTHDLDEAERLCDSITVLAGGRVVVEDTPAGLIAAEAERNGSSRDPPRRLHDLHRPLPRRGRRGGRGRRRIRMKGGENEMQSYPHDPAVGWSTSCREERDPPGARAPAVRAARDASVRRAIGTSIVRIGDPPGGRADLRAWPGRDERPGRLPHPETPR